LIENGAKNNITGSSNTAAATIASLIDNPFDTESIENRNTATQYPAAGINIFFGIGEERATRNRNTIMPSLIYLRATTLELSVIEYRNDCRIS